MKTPVLPRRKPAEASAPAVEPTAATTGPGAISPAPTLLAPKRRRRPALIAGGLIMVILGALGAYYLTQQSAQRIAVVGVAHQVAWGEKIAAEDLVQVQIVADPNLRPVLWTDASSLVGRAAATDLQPGSLLTKDSVTNDPIPPAGFALVGVQVDAGQLPVTALPARAEVLLVPTQGSSGSGQPIASAIAPTPAQIYTVGDVQSNGKRTVDVIVPFSVAPNVAAEAVAGRVAIVLLPVS